MGRAEFSVQLNEQPPANCNYRQKEHNAYSNHAGTGKIAMSPIVELRPPTAKKPTVRPSRAKNRGRAENTTYRSREYLTEAEIERLLAAAGKSRNPVRDRLLVLMAYRHALRVKELVNLQVDEIDLKAATIHIRRAKNGTPGIHGLQGDELRLIRALMRENGTHCRYLFISERGVLLSIEWRPEAH